MGLNVLDGRTSPPLLDAEADHAALTVRRGDVDSEQVVFQHLHGIFNSGSHAPWAPRTLRGNN